MDRERTVQVVLGEAERTGILRFVLEGEGFDIVGMASSDEELERVLAGARPSVIVLDGGISAAAALDARARATGASLVVVWPEGVAAVLADERVDPHLVIEDLGAAVRKASRRAEDRNPPIRIPEFLEVASPIEERRVAPARSDEAEPREPARPSRNRSRVLVAVTTWIMVLTALTTIAVAVPNALDLFDEDPAPRRSSSPAQTRRPNDGTVATDPERPGGKARVARCEPPRGVDERSDRSRGREVHPVGANGCPQDRGSRASGSREAGERGKPGDPGNQGNKGEPKGNKREANGEENPSEGRSAGDERNERGGDGKQHGADIDRVGDPGRSNNARSDRDEGATGRPGA